MELGEEGLTLARQVGDPRAIAASLANLGRIQLQRGNSTLARAWFEESLRLRKDIGDLGGMADVLLSLGHVAQQHGDIVTAIDRYCDSLMLRQQLGESLGESEMLAHLAAALAGRDPEIAVQLASASEAIGSTVPHAEQSKIELTKTLSALRSSLGDSLFSRARDTGRSLSVDQALALVRKRLETVKLAAMPSGELTPREVEVLRHLAQGLTYQQIADALVISTRTVDAHLRAIFGKLDVHSRGAATHVARQRGIL